MILVDSHHLLQQESYYWSYNLIYTMYYVVVPNKVIGQLRVTVLLLTKVNFYSHLATVHFAPWLALLKSVNQNALSWNRVQGLKRSSFTPQLQALPVLSTLVNSPPPRSTCPGVSPSSPMASWKDTVWSMSPARLWMVRNFTTLKALAEQIIENF